jgi:hypothetical protein
MQLPTSLQSTLIFWGATVCFSIGALYVAGEIWIQHKRRSRSGWIALVASFFCGAATFFNGVFVGFQGNGNWIWSGFMLGCLIGFSWSASLALLLQSLGRFLLRFKTKAQAKAGKSNAAKPAHPQRHIPAA